MAKFPGPYVNDVNADDPIMVRVPVEHADIGSRTSGMQIHYSNDMKIEHTGGQTSGTLTRRQS